MVYFLWYLTRSLKYQKKHNTWQVTNKIKSFFNIKIYNLMQSNTFWNGYKVKSTQRNATYVRYHDNYYRKREKTNIRAPN